MSTSAYLAKLDLEQLISARSEVDRLIAQKKSQTMVTVWCLEDALCTIESFGDYVEAAESLVKHAKENAAAAMPLRNRDMELSIVARKVPEDEYHQWVPCR